MNEVDQLVLDLKLLREEKWPVEGIYQLHHAGRDAGDYNEQIRYFEQWRSFKSEDNRAYAWRVRLVARLVRGDPDAMVTAALVVFPRKDATKG